MTADNKVDLTQELAENTEGTDNKESAFDVNSFFDGLEEKYNGVIYDEPEVDNTAQVSTDDEGIVATEESGGEMTDYEKELNNLQKRYDSSSKEAQRLAKKLESYEEVESLLPVMRVIQQDPNLLNQVRNYLESGTQPTSIAKEMGLEEDFAIDLSEAVDDPNSDSAKVLHRIVNAGVQKQMAIENERNRIKAQQDMEQQEMFRDFQKTHDLSDDQLVEFLEWSNNEKLTLDHLWQLKNLDSRDRKILKGSLEDRQRQLDKMQNTPNSLGRVGGGSPAEPENPDLAVFEAVMKAGQVNLLGES